MPESELAEAKELADALVANRALSRGRQANGQRNSLGEDQPKKGVADLRSRRKSGRGWVVL
jgi:hypothetical protein